MKQLLWAVANRLIYIIAILLPGIFGGWLTSLWAIPLAAAERGYTGAYGGEYLLIGFVFVMSVWAANAHLQAREEIRSIPVNRKKRKLQKKKILPTIVQTGSKP